MFKFRNTMLALAAIASLGIASLATTSSADARGFGGGISRGGGGGHVGMRIGGGRQFGGMQRIGGRVSLGHRVRIGQRVRLGHRPFVRFRPHWCHRFAWRCGIHVRWPRPIIYGAPVVAAATYATAPAAAPRCSCLTKEYTPEGLVVFQDVCTKEIASAPQGNTALPAPPANTTMPQSQTELQQPTQPQVR